MNTTRIIRYTLTSLLATMAFSACTWVEPAEEAADVTIVEARHVTTCERIGVTSASVKDRIGFIDRRDRTVAEELGTLAKNSAANMGGDTLVANSEIVEGTREFIVYRCN